MPCCLPETPLRIWLPGALAHERMIYIAHNSTGDAAAAVAGTIAGYEPHISPILKRVNIDSSNFTPSQIATINGTETATGGPAGRGVNWLADPILVPGRSIHMGEAYTGDPGGKKFIDIVRTIDDVSFRLKARLIQTIGNVRISRSGLRSMRTDIAAILTPLVNNEVIEDFEITIPVLTLLDKDPASLTATELTAINKCSERPCRRDPRRGRLRGRRAPFGHHSEIRIGAPRCLIGIRGWRSRSAARL